MKLCVNGCNCSLSRLDCIQPHFADEFAEQLRRVEHHNKREALRKPLPEFSDQRDGLLISPLEQVTQYTTLKVSVGEPLKAVLNDASVSFTWTITVQGQNWQTLFGIHLKSPAPVFQITDLEDASAQAGGNCQSDLVNWVVLSPADAILLGRLSFSVRATPEKMNNNYSCRVCLNLGFCQYAYISLGLVVNDPKLARKPLPSLPPPLDEYPPIVDHRPRVQSAPYHKRSADQSALATRPQSASSLSDEREAGSESGRTASTDHHPPTPSPSHAATVAAGRAPGNGGASSSGSRRVWDGARKWAATSERETGSGGEGGGKPVSVVTSNPESEPAAQDLQEPAQPVVMNSHTDHMTSDDVIASPTSAHSSSNV
jgi:hypothetical protein